MKNLVILFSFLLVTHLGFSQNYNVYVSGNVTDSLSNPVSGVMIHISGSSVFNPFSDSALTDSNGDYFDTIAISGLSQGALDIMMVNCHGDTVSGRGFFSPNSNVVVQDFVYCPSQGTGTGGSGFSIEGMVVATGATIANGRAYLIAQDSSSSNPYLRAVDSVDIRQGYYAFTGLDTGDYYVKAAVLPNAMSNPSLLPTYYGDELLWANATKISLYQDEKNINITMIPGTNPGGPGFIGGYVSQGANKKGGPGDPMEDVLVLLLTDQDEAVDYQYTDADGAYEFENIALGSYKLYVEIPGKESFPQFILLDEENKDVAGVNFSVNSTNIVSGIVELGDVISAVYPNPVIDELNIALSFEAPKAVDLKILTLRGQVISAKRVEAQTGKIETTMNLKDLPRGIYILSATDGEQTFHQKLLKQ